MGGTYSVNLPDGRIQHVNYHADDITGYVAEVVYDGTAAYPEVAVGHGVVGHGLLVMEWLMLPLLWLMLLLLLQLLPTLLQSLLPILLLAMVLDMLLSVENQF